MTFAYRLCLHLNIWEVETPGGFLDQCPAYQLQRWIEYFSLEPFGQEIKEQKDDVRVSITTSELINNVRLIAAGVSGKRMDMLNPDHFRISDRTKEIIKLHKSNRKASKTNKVNKDKIIRQTKVTEEQVFKDEMKVLKKLASKHGQPDPSPWQPVMIG